MYHKTYLFNDCLLPLWRSPYRLVIKTEKPENIHLSSGTELENTIYVCIANTRCGIFQLRNYLQALGTVIAP
jgi:hypothetical protein